MNEINTFKSDHTYIHTHTHIHVFVIDLICLVFVHVYVLLACSNHLNKLMIRVLLSWC